MTFVAMVSVGILKLNVQHNDKLPLYKFFIRDDQPLLDLGFHLCQCGSLFHDNIERIPKQRSISIDVLCESGQHAGAPGLLSLLALLLTSLPHDMSGTGMHSQPQKRLAHLVQTHGTAYGQTPPAGDISQSPRLWWVEHCHLIKHITDCTSCWKTFFPVTSNVGLSAESFCQHH